MDYPKITLEVETDNVATPQQKVDGGAAYPGETLKLLFQIWNNRWGTETINNAINCVLIVRSSYIDELLPILSNSIIKVDGRIIEIPKLIKDKISIPIKDLSGQSNRGDKNDNPENVSEVEIEFTTPNGFKTGNKNLIFDMEFNSTNY